MTADITTSLFYGQKVYLALAKCACSEAVHDVSYTKVGAGNVLKYVEDTDSYMVDVTNNGVPASAINYCPCGGYDVGMDSTKKDIKSIARNHIFVMDINDRSVVVGDMEVCIGDILNVYPYSDKYKVISISSDMKLILACDVNGIANSGTMDIVQMIIIDLDDPSTFISDGDGTPVIPYTYTVPTEIEEPDTDPEDGGIGD